MLMSGSHQRYCEMSFTASAPRQRNDGNSFQSFHSFSAHNRQGQHSISLIQEQNHLLCNQASLPVKKQC